MKNYYTLIFLIISITCQSQKLSFTDKKLVADFDRFNNKPFRALQLEDQNGNIINTDSLKGKIIYVDCWFTSCPPCLAEIPFAKALQLFYTHDTTVVFLNICIDNVERKDAWKKLVKEKELGGIHVFYARNRPQTINLLREYGVDDYPTYLVLNTEMKVIGHNAPPPSAIAWVHWALNAASKNIKLSDAYLGAINKSKSFTEFMVKNRERMDSLQPKK